MTDKEIQDQHNQVIQDNITIEYPAWADRQRRAKLSTDHELWQQERDRVLARRQSDNAEARSKHLAKLENERKAKQAETDREIELSHAPEKKRLQNEWLANNPSETAADFEKKAWHLLKENLIEQRKTEIVEADKRSMLATGRYSL